MKNNKEKNLELKNNNTSKRNKEIKPKKKKIKKAVIIIITIVIITLGVKLAIYTHNWKMLDKDMILNENSIVKDIDGNIIAKLGSEKKKKVVKYDEIPSNLKNAYVAIEDERFYSHHGVDVTRTLSAIGSYQNIPFILIMEKLTPKTSINYLEKMGVTTLTKKDQSLPLSLGGLEKGISPLQMTGAYATIANDGEYIEPTFYSKIDRKNGETVVKTTQNKRRVFSKKHSGTEIKQEEKKSYDNNVNNNITETIKGITNEIDEKETIIRDMQ